MQAKITKRTVDAIHPQTTEQWVWDTEIKGFGLRVRPNGRKSYVVEYRPGAGGRSAPKRRYTIGTHGSPWTPDMARREALRILGRKQEDPAARRMEARRREGETVRQIGDSFIEKYAKLKQRRWQETQRVFVREVYPAFGAKPIEDVTRRDIVRLLDGIAERGPVMANRTLAYVRRFFNWCIERGYLEKSPCNGIRPPGVAAARERTLDDVELAAVLNAASRAGHPWTPIFKLLALTAQRRSEVVEMRWEEVDLDAATWTIPGTRTKNSRTHEVPLTDSAVALLREVPRLLYTDEKGKRAASPFVFTTTGRTPVSGLSRAKSALDATILEVRRKDDPQAEPLPHWTIHDLRRTATTGMARLGIHPHVADAILNHKDGTIRGVAAVYNRHAHLEERRSALEAWERHVLALQSRPPRSLLTAAVRG